MFIPPDCHIFDWVQEDWKFTGTTPLQSWAKMTSAYFTNVYPTESAKMVLLLIPFLF